MDRQLAERMVGAACLLAVLVLVVPAILDGNPDSDSTLTHSAAEEELDLRTHTIRLDGSDREPPVPTPVQAAAAPKPMPEPAPGPTPEPDSPPAVPTAADVETGDSAPATAQPPMPAPAAARAPAAEAAAAEPVARDGNATGGTGDWLVQLGSFSSRANADRLAADVRRKGFNVSVAGGGGTSGNLFRVRAGPEPDKAGAEALAARLAAAGFKGGRIGRK